MALGRLQLGDVEQTGYDARNGESVDISFRHATKGELNHSLAQQGISLDEEGSALIEDGNPFGLMAALENADVELAKLCITESTVGVAEIEREILVQIGEYLREKAAPSEDEGKD